MLAERRHIVAERVAVRYLVDEAKPRSDVSDVLWRRKVTDYADMFVTGLDIGRSGDTTSKFNRVGAKYKFFGVLNNSVSPANVYPTTCLKEAFFESVCPLACVIDAFGFVGEVIDNLVESSGVSIL